MADPDRGVMGSFVRIEDGDGVLLPGTPGGPATLGLVNFGVEDGQEAVPSLRPELGTFTHPRAKKGPVKVALIPDPSAASEVDALAKQIISLVDGFKSEMETALLPWMTAWNRQGLLSIPAAYRTGKMKGFNAWWEGEVGFWASVGDWISSAFDAAAQALLHTASEFWDWYVDLPWYDRLNPLGAYARQALEALFENAKDLWEQREQIMALVKGFATGSIDAIEKGLEALVDIPGEIGELARLLVDKSAEWTGGLIEMVRETDVVEKLAAATFAIIMMMPPNLWAEAIGAVEGYLLPEVLIAAVFAIIAACTDGAGAPLLTARLTSFVTKTRAALSRIGDAGELLLKIFAKLEEIAELVSKLFKALKRKVDEAMHSATEMVTKIVRRSGKRIKPPADIPCFRKPAGVSTAEFVQQLKEQENAINNSDISELIARRKMVNEVTTKVLRNPKAQAEAREDWLVKRRLEIAETQGISRKKAAELAAREAKKLDATHVLDIVAGGDPSAISGLQDRSVNRSIGSQWAKGGRVEALDSALVDHAARGGIKAHVKLTKCRG